MQGQGCTFGNRTPESLGQAFVRIVVYSFSLLVEPVRSCRKALGIVWISGRERGRRCVDAFELLPVFWPL